MSRIPSAAFAKVELAVAWKALSFVIVDQQEINTANRLNCECVCVCVCVSKGRQMSLSTCENREALKDVAALLSSRLLVSTGIMCKCALHSSADISDSQRSCCDGPPDSTAKCEEGGLQPENLIKF